MLSTLDMAARDASVWPGVTTLLPKAPRAIKVLPLACTTTPQEFVFLSSANDAQASSCSIVP